MAESWRCPYCGNMATIGTYDIAEAEAKSIEIHDVVDYFAASIRIVKCPNPDCSRLSVYSSVEQRSKYNVAVGEAKIWQLIPEASVRHLPDYIPEAIRQDYTEAYLIKDKSPKASATLSRRCLQGMIRDFWGVKPGNLDEIARRIDELAGERDRLAIDIAELEASAPLFTRDHVLRWMRNVVANADPLKAVQMFVSKVVVDPETGDLRVEFVVGDDGDGGGGGGKAPNPRPDCPDEGSTKLQMAPRARVKSNLCAYATNSGFGLLSFRIAPNTADFRRRAKA